MPAASPIVFHFGLRATLGVLLLGGCAAASTGSLPASSGDDDDSAEHATDTSTTPKTSKTAKTSTGSATSSTKDSGPVSHPAADAGATPPDAVDVFANAATPGAEPPAETANSHHLSAITGRACLNCHGGSKATPDGVIETLLSKEAPEFTFGGTIAGQSGVEVRVVDDKGALVGSALTDDDGNFWMLGPNTIPKAHVGVRTTKTAVMHTALPHGNCATSSCHDSQRPITAPAP